LAIYDLVVVGGVRGVSGLHMLKTAPAVDYSICATMIGLLVRLRKVQ
jgi:hypothetical protein